MELTFLQKKYDKEVKARMQLQKVLVEYKKTIESLVGMFPPFFRYIALFCILHYAASLYFLCIVSHLNYFSLYSSYFLLFSDFIPLSGQKKTDSEMVDKLKKAESQSAEAEKQLHHLKKEMEVIASASQEKETRIQALQGEVDSLNSRLSGSFPFHIFFFFFFLFFVI